MRTVEYPFMDHKINEEMMIQLQIPHITQQNNTEEIARISSDRIPKRKLKLSSKRKKEVWEDH
jgi:hypothetical protein